MGVESFLLVSTVKTVISQRLVRRLTKAKEQYFLSAEEESALRSVVDMDNMLEILKKQNAVARDATWKTIPLYRPKPSEESTDGYSGRINIQEVLTVSLSIRQLILSGASAEEIENQAKKEGMTTMLEDGIYNAVVGNTTTEEVLRVVSE